MFHVGDDDGADDLRDELGVLLAFLSRRPLTTAVRDLERALDGCHGMAAAEEVAAAGVDANCSPPHRTHGPQYLSPPP